MSAPLKGNRTWQVADDIVREQVVGGSYRYHTPVGVVWCIGDSGSWRLKWDEGFTSPLKTLADCDAVVRSWMDELKVLGIPAMLAQEKA